MGEVHFWVPNMPSAVARTSTLALTQAILPYALTLANHGLKEALAVEPRLLPGLQTHAGHVTHADLARETGRVYVEAQALLL